MGSNSDIILYTNHACPWAHRAHIALDELQIPYKEEIIDLTVPRTKEYLAVNPRGLVPSIKYNGEIFTESAVVSWLIADAYPGQLVPLSNAADGPQRRARITFFVDTFFTKFQSQMVKLISAKESEAEPIVDAAVEQLVKEVEPLLKDAKPFFGGSDKITLAEVLTGSFVLRVVRLGKNPDIYPAKLTSSIAEKAPNFWNWAQKVSEQPSVTRIFNEEKITASTKARIAKARAAA